nr:winged helix-turn-helix domain-containing protein [Streptomyces sp. NBC_00190]
MRRRLRVRLSTATVWRLLRRHGWSWQAPARRALERDEHAVEWEEGGMAARGSTAAALRRRFLEAFRTCSPFGTRAQRSGRPGSPTRVKERSEADMFPGQPGEDRPHPPIMSLWSAREGTGGAYGLVVFRR